ncbi:MAG TPA: NmrA family NAD(P)-binding protein [Vicinamibacteria bacterium]|nr:NmrA family NAD(P)-binding protein [Vicinamibacteria bacterium]
MIAIMGATGHTGQRIGELLLDAGEKVRVLGRSAAKLEPLRKRGAEIETGDAEDARFLARAFRGADAVFTLIPPDVRAADYLALGERIGEATASAVRESGVQHVVFLSSVGADVPEGTGPIAGLHAQEERLRRLEGANLLVLRAAYFFENFYSMLGLIKHQGINGGGIAPDVPIPMIATRDIAEVAARALRERDFEGFTIRELLGPRDLTHAEATRILGTRLGNPELRYVQLGYDELEKALVGMGVSENVATLYAELDHALNEGLVRSLEGRRPENTTPTGFEDFAAELAAAYRAMP